MHKWRVGPQADPRPRRLSGAVAPARFGTACSWSPTVRRLDLRKFRLRRFKYPLSSRGMHRDSSASRADTDVCGDDLPPRQAEAHRFIAMYIDRHGRSPTSRDISAFLQVKSTNPQSYIYPLIAKGYLDRYPGKAHRNLRVTERGRYWLDARPQLALDL